MTTKNDKPKESDKKISYSEINNEKIKIFIYSDIIRLKFIAVLDNSFIIIFYAEARENGELSENAEYESAREAQSLLEIKIANLKNMVANAKVVDSSMLSTDKVQMLNTVKVENLNTHQKMTFTIVGESEADFSKGKLAATTPIAKALLGHGVDEVAAAQGPAG